MSDSNNKKIVRLAVIRDNESDVCPFGLNVTIGCCNAGNLVDKMVALNNADNNFTPEELNDIARANNRLFMWQASKHQCKYAGEIFKNNNKVECNWGDTTAGQGEPKTEASTFYSKVYNNVALDGLYSYPMGYYADNNISRNLYYGLYSIIGNNNVEEINKFASYVAELNDNFDKLPEQVKFVLKDFAINYANKSALIKKGDYLIPHLNHTFGIIDSWKEKI